jgi:hypothetical protein
MTACKIFGRKKNHATTPLKGRGSSSVLFELAIYELQLMASVACLPQARTKNRLKTRHNPVPFQDFPATS